MHINDWNFLKWKLPDRCRQVILKNHIVKECYYNGLILSASKKYDLFKMITESGKEIAIFCKNSMNNEMILHRKIWNILQRENCPVKVPKCYGFWKNKLFMEYVSDTITFEKFLTSNYSPDKLEILLGHLGGFLALLHNNGFLHKDLNLSNILYSSKTQNIYIIDFELTEVSTSSNYQNNVEEIQSIVKKLKKYIKHIDGINFLNNAYYANLQSRESNHRNVKLFSEANMN